MGTLAISENTGNCYDINILRNEVRIMWNVSKILRVSAFALVHFQSNNCLFIYLFIYLFFFLPGEDEISMPFSA